MFTKSNKLRPVTKEAKRVMEEKGPHPLYIDKHTPKDRVYLHKKINEIIKELKGKHD